jgi:hypothetical protein
MAAIPCPAPTRFDGDFSGPQVIPEIGRFAVIADPQGAVFFVIKLENPD